ncbi:MAG: NAD(P)/FAD-dependent oxidoreductase [Thermodesulfobacteriota bacterium]
MQNRVDYQVVIAGAGPAGLLLAQKLAEQSVSVAVYEPREENALGHDWSDAVEKSALNAAGFDVPEALDGRYAGKLVKTSEEDGNLFEPHCIAPLEIRSPDLSCTVDGGVEFRYITTDRKALARMLVQRAVEAGAAIFYRHRAENLLGDTAFGLENIRVSGMRVTDLENRQSFDVSARIAVDATGLGAMLRTGFSGESTVNRKFEGGELAYACRTVRRLDANRAKSDDLVDHYRYGAYRGYFWTHLHHPDSVDVGGGVREEPGRVDPMDIIEEMIADRPSITGEKLRGGGGTVLVGKSPFSLVASGFAAVGDAAGQVIPTTGCGVGGAMTGALLSAGVIHAALKKNDCSIKALWPYNYVWFSGRGSHFAALSALKDILQDLSHEEISFLMQKGIMNSKTLTPAINGVFAAPDISDIFRTLANGFSRPGLLMKLNRANSIGRKIFLHYRKYPDKWDPEAFSRWVETARKLYEKI